jgi:hypothetical protein
VASVAATAVEAAVEVEARNATNAASSGILRATALRVRATAAVEAATVVATAVDTAAEAVDVAWVGRRATRAVGTDTCRGTALKDRSATTVRVLGHQRERSFSLTGLQQAVKSAT